MTATYTDTRLLIDNEWVDATGGKTLDVVNPATGKAIGKVAHASIADLDRALAAAQRGFEKWRNTPANERAAVMRRAAGLIRERALKSPGCSRRSRASRWPKPRAKRWLPPTSSSGSPMKAAASTAASCPRATWPRSSW